MVGCRGTTDEEVVGLLQPAEVATRGHLQRSGTGGHVGIGGGDVVAGRPGVTGMLVTVETCGTGVVPLEEIRAGLELRGCRRHGGAVQGVVHGVAPFALGDAA